MQDKIHRRRRTFVENGIKKIPDPERRSRRLYRSKKSSFKSVESDRYQIGPRSTLFQYVSFDYLWWVAAAYFMVRLLASQDPRWCLAVGAAIGLGMLTKYTMIFLAVGISAGFLFTPARCYLRSPWLWCGIALAFVIFLPNFLWQIRHHFVSLDFLKSIHARDIRIGRTDTFVLDQFWIATNPLTVPFWLAGLFYLFA